MLLDNFYVESEVSADGHEWTTAAYATDFVEKTWPLVYRKGDHGEFRYPSEGALEVAFPSSGYIWDRCKEAGLSYSQLWRVRPQRQDSGRSGNRVGESPGRALRSQVSQL